MKAKKWTAFLLSIVSVFAMFFVSACDKITSQSSKMDDLPASVGLRYHINEDGETCTIMGMGTCTDTHLVIPREIDGYTVTEISRGASFGEAVTDITILPDTLTVYYSSFANTSYFANEENWEDDILYIGQYLVATRNILFGDCTIKSGTTTIAVGAFAYPSSMTEELEDEGYYGQVYFESITIPKSVKKICAGAFYYEKYLYENWLPVTNFSVYIEDLTAWCGIEFEDLQANPLNRYYVEDMRAFVDTNVGAINHFYLKGKLFTREITKLDIPDGVTEVKDYAFAGCQSIVSAELPETVTHLGECAFIECYSLKTLSLPKSLETVGGQMYTYNHCAEKVDFQGSIKDWCKIEFTFVGYVGAMRFGRTLLMGADLYIQGNLIENLVVPETITTLKDCTFMGCKSIKTVTISASVTSIERQVFAGCENLQTITFKGTVAQWNAIPKGEDWARDTDVAKVVCTDGEVFL